LFLVLIVLLAVLYSVKKLKLGKYASNQQIKVLNMVSIGAKEKIVLIEVNQTKLVLGATPNHIETLYSYTDTELESSYQKAKAFSDELNAVKATAT
jgi:flagellar protein FliO/FliZ